jgi:elongation factor G
MEFPDPVVRVAVEPKTRQDQDKMGVALNRLLRKIRASKFQRSTKPDKRLLPEWASCTLEIIVDRMKREFGVEANVGKAAGCLSRNDNRQAHQAKKSTKNNRVVAVNSVTSNSKSNRLGAKDLSLKIRITGGSIPRQFIKPTMEGVRDAMQRGFRAGYELVVFALDCCSVPITKLTRTKFHSSGRLLSLSRCSEKGQSRFCLNRL